MLRKIRAAICDEEELYCSRLAEYLQANQSEMVEACVCSQKKELKKLLLESGVDVVLMTEDFFAPDILSYGGVVFALLGDEMVSEEYREYPCILKYQKAPEILRGICRLAGERLDDTKMVSVLGKEKRSVAFYSPHQEFSQMYLAMGYAKICAAKERVLYLNLMECAGFEELFEEKYKENIGDFLFYLRRQEKNLRLRFESMLHQFGDVDYLPPVFFGEILREAGKEDYQALLVWLLAETDYDVIAWDLTRENQGAKQRLGQFLQCVEEYGGAALRERLHLIPVSGQCVISQGKSLMQELEWGEFGDYIRKQLKGGANVEGAGG